MKIRKANKKDLDGIVEISELMLEYHANLDKYYNIYSKYNDSRKFYKDQLKDKNMRFIVAEDDDKELVGFTSGSIAGIPKTRAPKIGTAITIFVKKEYRNKKIGEKLSKELMKWFKDNKVKHIEASVDVKNKKALKRWKKSGFHDYQVLLRMDL